jgi:hypothetical protein
VVCVGAPVVGDALAADVSDFARSCAGARAAVSVAPSVPPHAERTVTARNTGSAGASALVRSFRMWVPSADCLVDLQTPDLPDRWTGTRRFLRAPDNQGSATFTPAGRRLARRRAGPVVAVASERVRGRAATSPRCPIASSVGTAQDPGRSQLPSPAPGRTTRRRVRAGPREGIAWGRRGRTGRAVRASSAPSPHTRTWSRNPVTLSRFRVSSEAGAAERVCSGSDDTEHDRETE